MSKNIHQIFVSNPATSMQSTDLLYIGRSPYDATDDFAITWANLEASISGSVVWVDVVSGTQTAAPNTGYICDNGASIITFTLPTTIALGQIIEIAGKAAGGWTIGYGTGQQIRYGSLTTTTTTGTLSSSAQGDCVKLLCTTANTGFTVLSSIGNLSVA